MAANSDKIRHVFVLMLENRSFDHFLGCLPGVDGVPSPPSENFEAARRVTKYVQLPNAAYEMKLDPMHEWHNVVAQIAPKGLPPMGGFVADFVQRYPKSTPDQREQVMSYFGLGSLPVTHALAQQFCVCDRWFSSVPGPTWTNRFFLHSGTSQGWVEMPSASPTRWRHMHKYDQTTLYDRLNEKHVDWRIYYDDVPQSLVLANQRKPVNRHRYWEMAKFYRHLQEVPAGDYPSYVLIEPNYFWPGQNDQHPPHDVLAGDELIGRVYNAIRSRKDIWEHALLVVLWDEHGGFYDHVSPPPATPPDDLQGDGFAFDRYGVRVPALLISRWVKPGSVFRAKAGTGELDHTSVLRYMTDKFDLGSLGDRVRSAASIEEAIQPVPDDSSSLFTAMAGARRALPRTPSARKAKPVPLNENQRALMEFARTLEEESAPPPAPVLRRRARARPTGIRRERLVGAEPEVAQAIRRVDAFIGRGR